MPYAADPGSTFEEDRFCPECGSAHLVRDYERGEVVCGACGLVLAERAIDHGPEWVPASVEEAERLARTGPPRKPLTGASGLTTVVPFPGRDIRGRRIPERARQTFYRLRRLQMTSAQSLRGERSSVAMARVLDRIVSQLGLPNAVRDEAALLCKRALGAGIVRGRSTVGIVAAAVYAACRIDGVPRTLSEIARATGVSRKAIARHHREFLRAGAFQSVPLPRAQDYVGRFCADLGLSSRAHAETLRLLGEWDRVGITGSSSPVAAAATAIYLVAEACGEPKFQTQVAKATGVTEVTLRTHLRRAGRFPARVSAVRKSGANRAMWLPLRF